MRQSLHLLFVLIVACTATFALADSDTNSGWIKSPANPVLGGKLGTCFDVSLLKEDATYRMYFSWRPKKGIALTESTDGIHWSDPVLALRPDDKCGWQLEVNRPVVLKRPDGYRMWYSGGEQHEPDAIGYATSPDGRVWTRNKASPIFTADPKSPWERHQVTACQVVKQGEGWVMFYIGFQDVHRARIGIARTNDGITNWQRLPANPIISPGTNQWDADACYKPFAIYEPESNRWLLWYNGRHGTAEQIGLATHVGQELGF